MGFSGSGVIHTCGEIVSSGPVALGREHVVIRQTVGELSGPERRAIAMCEEPQTLPLFRLPTAQTVPAIANGTWYTPLATAVLHRLTVQHRCSSQQATYPRTSVDFRYELRSITEARELREASRPLDSLPLGRFPLVSCCADHRPGEHLLSGWVDLLSPEPGSTYCLGAKRPSSNAEAKCEGDQEGS